MTRSFRVLASSLLTVAALLVAGCGDDDTSDPAAPTVTEPDGTLSTSPSTTSPTATTSPSDTTSTTDVGSGAGGGGGAGEDCWVHLFEEDDFAEDDDHLRLVEPGRYADLRSLPGATDDWTDEAESIRVGPAATVTIWPETDFRGEPIELGPGSERQDLDEEPESLELTC